MRLRNYRRIAQIEDRKAAAAEKKYATAIRKALKQQGEHFILHGEIDNSMYPVIENLYTSLFNEWLPRQWDQLERNVVKSRFFSQTWLMWIKEFVMTELLAKVTAIDETTRTTLRSIVSEGASSGIQFEEMSEKVRQATSGAIGRRRARMIARTEVGEAINTAKTKSAEDWESETDAKLGKLWIHRGAKDPRDWHVALDNGISIPKEETWTVTNPNTGETDNMKHPHDPSASAGNVINCGCQVIYTRWKEE
jgi:hypothetical protein